MEMTLKDAIQHAKEVANSKCDECGKEHAKLAEWLQELEYYKDPTPITKEWLEVNTEYHRAFPIHYYQDCDRCLRFEYNNFRQGYECFAYRDSFMKGECRVITNTVGELNRFLSILGEKYYGQEVEKTEDRGI